LGGIRRGISSGLDAVTSFTRSPTVSPSKFYNFISEKKPIVIGEDQFGRVDIFARQEGGETITDWLERTGKNWSPQANREFIDAMKQEGRSFIDIGLAFDRRRLNNIDPSQGRPASNIYGNERMQLLDYEDRIQVYERTGKFDGGVPGLDY